MTDQTLRMQFRSIGDEDVSEEEGHPTRLPSADDDDENSGIIPDLELEDDIEDDGLGGNEEEEGCCIF